MFLRVDVDLVIFNSTFVCCHCLFIVEVSLDITLSLGHTALGWKK